MIRWIVGFFMVGVVLISGSAVVAQNDAAEGSGLPACAEASGGTPVTEEDESSRPDWQMLELTNAETNETFTIADFAGCPILIETMATWCGSCFEQLGRIQEATQTLEPETFVVIALSVENGLPDATLADYQEQTGFSFVFSVASLEMLDALNEEFGFTVLVPPATPHIYVAPDGAFTDLITGGSSVETVIETIESLAESGTV